MKLLMRNTPLLAVLAFLSGCAGTAPSAPPQPAAPAQWLNSPAQAAEPNWAGLLDPQLAALQAQADAANRDISQAALRLRQAQTTQDQGALRLTPSAGLNTSASRPLQQNASTRTVDIGGVSVPVPSNVGWSRSYGASVSLGYELDLWDRLSNSQAAQAAQTEVARSDVEAARRLIRNRVAESYWTLAASAQQLPLAQAQAAVNQEVLQLVSLRVREGKLLPIEIDKAASALQQSQVRLADLGADARIQRHTLALLLDQPLPGPELSAPRLPVQALSAWAPGDPASVLARRPDVQRARLGVDVALARARAADAERYPRLSFSASVSTGSAKAADWFKDPLVSLASNLVVPLIDWRRLDLQRDNARTDVELAALALRDSVAKAVLDVETQLIDGERLAQQLAANARRVDEAAQAETLAALRLEVGAIARADWLQAQSARLEAEQGRIQLLLRAWLNRAALVKAAGG